MREGNVLTHVCLSVCPQRGGGTYLGWGKGVPNLYGGGVPTLERGWTGGGIPTLDGGRSTYLRFGGVPTLDRGGGTYLGSGGRGTYLGWGGEGYLPWTGRGTWLGQKGRGYPPLMGGKGYLPWMGERVPTLDRGGVSSANSAMLQKSQLFRSLCNHFSQIIDPKVQESIEYDSLIARHLTAAMDIFNIHSYVLCTRTQAKLSINQY